jgi:NADPH:quinone reductase and related Zn-dependent oxidoreductases
MKATVIEHYGEDNVKLENIDIPKINDDQVLIKVVGASINPIDLKTAEGKLKFLLPYKMPLTLGSDFSGIVAEIGKDVSTFAIGDEVYGRVRKDMLGTFAQYLVVDPSIMTKKPEISTFQEAAALPLVSLTSYQALHDVMKIKAGDKILIQAGAGGIGTVAIQLAKLAGAYVATTSSQKNISFLKNLGADEVIDYHKDDFSELLTDYDYVFDTMGGEILDKSFKILRKGGMIVSISGVPDLGFAKSYGLPYWKKLALKIATRKIRRLEKEYQVAYHFLFMKPSGEQLEVIRSFVENKQLTPILDLSFPLVDIKKSFDYSAKGHVRGKVTIDISDEDFLKK